MAVGGISVNSIFDRMRQRSLIKLSVREKIKSKRFSRYRNLLDKYNVEQRDNECIHAYKNRIRKVCKRKRVNTVFLSIVSILFVAFAVYLVFLQ